MLTCVVGRLEPRLSFGIAATRFGEFIVSTVRPRISPVGRSDVLALDAAVREKGCYELVGAGAVHVPPRPALQSRIKDSFAVLDIQWGPCIRLPRSEQQWASCGLTATPADMNFVPVSLGGILYMGAGGSVRLIVANARSHTVCCTRAATEEKVRRRWAHSLYACALIVHIKRGPPFILPPLLHRDSPVLK